MSISASNEKYNELVAKKVKTQEKLAKMQRDRQLQEETNYEENLNRKLVQKVSKSREREAIERF